MKAAFVRHFLPLIVVMLAMAGSANADPAPRMLSVSGSGEIKAAPDAAQLSTGVVTQASTAAQALTANARAMNAVFDTLKSAGIADKNIQTSGISLSPQYTNAKAGQAPHISGYQVTNTVSVLVDSLDKVGPTLDALVAAGSNQIDGPNFIIADPKPLLARARAEAVKDAIAKAQAYAAAAGVTLGPILSISEGGSMVPQPMDRMMMSGGPREKTPVAAGEESVTASVSITWGIQ